MGLLKIVLFYLSLCYNFSISGEDMHTVTKNEYYDYVLKDSEFHKPSCDINNIPETAKKLYQFMDDFLGRRGLRQNWESYLSAQEEQELMNKLYLAIMNNQFNDKEDVNILIQILKKVPGNPDTFSEIDDDIIDEIKQTWFDIVK